MKDPIKRGWWLTRGGEEVWVETIHRPGDRPIVGWNKNGNALSWMKGGRALVMGDYDTDLVEYLGGSDEQKHTVDWDKPIERKTLGGEGWQDAKLVYTSKTGPRLIVTENEHEVCEWVSQDNPTYIRNKKTKRVVWIGIENEPYANGFHNTSLIAFKDQERAVEWKMYQGQPCSVHKIELEM